jgi:predicted KAP-like P-loop ATPase
MWSDNESKIDYLNFSEIGESISDIVTTPELLPISIGVFGDWGAGKSTILELTESAITKENPQFIHIKFDAWLFQGYDDARAAILETIAKALIHETESNKSLKDKAEAFYNRVDKIRALGMAADVGATLAGVPTFGILGKLFGSAQDIVEADDESLSKELKEGKKDLEAVKKATGQLLKPKTKKSPPQEIIAFRKEFKSLIKEIGRPIVVYVDNLDRCTPINAIHTLEAIRLFLFLSNTAFIIAADEEMIRTAVSEYHKGATDRHQTDYLDKLIQVPVNVPKPGILEIRAYLYMLVSGNKKLSTDNLEILRTALESSLRNSWKDEPIKASELLSLLKGVTEKDKDELELNYLSVDRMATILATSPRINGNPRIVKRLLNVVKMRKKVADRRKMNLDESIITKLVIFERCAGQNATKELYQLIDKERGMPEIFKALENPDNTSELLEPFDTEFVKKWAELPPTLSGVDLRAAAYLSRETIPMGTINISMSSQAMELVELIMATAHRSSPALINAIDLVPSEDYLAVTESVIDNLRKVSNWEKRPNGVSGVILMADKDKDSKAVVLKYLSGINTQPWLNKIIKGIS